MQETLTKLSEQVRAKIAEAFQRKELQDFVAATKAVHDSGSFEVIISTADLDRQGESIDQTGWDLGFYLQNPIVLWAHDYDSLPIAICDEVAVKDGKLAARGRFAPESANPFAQQVRRLYDLKIVRATSVGFIVKDQQGNKINKAELLEFSFVPVPANPYALSTQRAIELGLNLEMLAMKGIKLSEKDLPNQGSEEGEPCKLEDGTDGVWTPDENGSLVCKIAIKPSEGSTCTTSDGKEGTWKQGESGMVCVVKATPDPVPPSEQPPDTPQEGDVCKMPDGSPGVLESDDETGELVCVPKIEEKPKTAAATDAAKAECLKHEEEMKTAVVAHTQKIVDILNRDDGNDGGAQDNDAKALKAGRVISEKNRSLIKQAIEQFKASIAALEELLTATEPQGSEGKEQPDGAAPNERSNAAGYGSIEEMNQILVLRSVLRSINNGSAQALENINRRLRNPKK